MLASREVITCLSVLFSDLCECCLEYSQLTVEDEEIAAVYFVLVILLHSTLEDSFIRTSLDFVCFNTTKASRHIDRFGLKRWASKKNQGEDLTM